LDIDLLFAVVTPEQWRTISGEGTLRNTYMDGEDSIWCFEGKHAEEVINEFYEGDSLLLIVLDPLRIQAPFKRITKNGFEIIEIKQSISIDVIIDRIKLNPDKKGKYSMNVKHFD
jgi:uncharacterized protein (DUF952 family)